MKRAILIVDDNAAMREALTEILFPIAAPVFTAANGQEGLEILLQQRQHIILILLDMDMPIMNGEQTYAKLQEMAPDIKVIISTSLSQVEVQSRLKHRKVPTLLQKPFGAETLLNVVQTELAMA